MSRELDAKVAEGPMGWVRWESERGVRPDEWCEPQGVTKGLTGIAKCYVHDFQPSTSIADAWLVVEKMTKDGEWPCVHVSPGERETENGDYENHRWRCHIEKQDGTAVVRFADTAPEAICLAALEASQGETS